MFSEQCSVNMYKAQCLLVPDQQRKEESYICLIPLYSLNRKLRTRNQQSPYSYPYRRERKKMVNIQMLSSFSITYTLCTYTTGFCIQFEHRESELNWKKYEKFPSVRLVIVCVCVCVLHLLNSTKLNFYLLLVL